MMVCMNVDIEPSASLVIQELKHYSQALQDLQQALTIEPENKAFAKELERLKQDCAEHRKQRAVLKQIDSSNISASPAPKDRAAQSMVDQADGNAAIGAQLDVQQAGNSITQGPATDLHKMKMLVMELQKQVAGDSSVWCLCSYPVNLLSKAASSCQIHPLCRV